MKTVVLAGGKGERLRPLTSSIPKPMIPINGKPLLWYILMLLKKYDITDIIITLCYLPEIIQNYFQNGEKFGMKIQYIIEDKSKPLGTAGALAFLAKDLKQTFIVCSGDILRNLDINAIVNFHKEKRGIATLCIYKNPNPNPKSSITVNHDDKITTFTERPTRLPEGDIWTNASFYVFEPEVLTCIAKEKPADFGKDVFPKLLARKKRLYAYKSSDYFLDIGTTEKMKKAEEDSKKGKLVCY